MLVRKILSICTNMRFAIGTATTSKRLSRFDLLGPFELSVPENGHGMNVPSLQRGHNRNGSVKAWPRIDHPSGLEAIRIRGASELQTPQAP
jgi:hypothetical protein